MILPFSTQFKNGTPTYFIDKIWHSITINGLVTNGKKEIEYADLFFDKLGYYWDGCLEFSQRAPKPHTIREDIHDRWHEGCLIHPVVFNRSKNQFQFAPTLVCKSVQKIEIFEKDCLHFMKIDGRSLNWQEVKILAKNDGFKSITQFFEWFNKDFTGKIIHWTKLKY
jgi:hypothetical protein